MIATTDLAKEYGARTLFEDVSLQLNAGLALRPRRRQRLGQDHVPAHPRRRRGGVRGDGRRSSSARASACCGRTASSTTTRSSSTSRCAATRSSGTRSTEQRRIADSGDHADAGRIADLEDLIAAHDGYTLEARASAVLEGLGIPTAVHRPPLATLSGGFKLRVLLAQVLVGGADVLLLDEPTNHLDILSIRWLEKFLAGYAGCAVIISHDQRFLDNVTSHTLDVDYGTITLYTGSYSTAMVEKAAARARKEAAIARAEDEIARKRAFVERFGAKATKATQAQSRLKQIEKIEVEELAASSRRAPGAPLRARAPERPRRAGAGGRQQVVRRQARADERVADRPARRAGRHHRPQRPRQVDAAQDRRRAPRGRRGRVRWGHEARVGYFPQDHREVLTDGEATPLDPF